jgi:uncharacterized membrane protein HdeD (DUF308 family)
VRIATADTENVVATWSAVLFRGLAAVSFALVTVIVPGLSLVALELAFGAYALVDGILTLITALRGRGATEPLWLLGCRASLASALARSRCLGAASARWRSYT